MRTGSIGPRRLGAAALVAAALIGGAIALSQANGGGSGEPPSTVTGAAEVQRQYSGIPQHGIELGRPDAPVTLTEFADLQCPFCREYALDVLPTLVRRYVRAGRLRLVFEDLAFLGPDSTAAGLFAAAAGGQDRLWQFADLMYRNQGRENTGYVTDSYLRRLARATPGLDADRAFDDRGSTAAANELDQAAALARRFGIDSTPSFLLTPRGGRPERLQVASLTPGAFTGPIDAALGGR